MFTGLLMVLVLSQPSPAKAAEWAAFDRWCTEQCASGKLLRSADDDGKTCSCSNGVAYVYIFERDATSLERHMRRTVDEGQPRCLRCSKCEMGATPPPAAAATRER